jgi:hypothetical protein
MLKLFHYKILEINPSKIPFLFKKIIITIYFQFKEIYKNLIKNFKIEFRKINIDNKIKK